MSKEPAEENKRDFTQRVALIVVSTIVALHLPIVILGALTSAHFVAEPLLHDPFRSYIGFVFLQWEALAMFELCAITAAVHCRRVSELAFVLIAMCAVYAVVAFGIVNLRIRMN